jgi:hypothetical protein
MVKSTPGVAGWVASAIALAVAAVVLAMYSQLEERTIEESLKQNESIASLTDRLGARTSELEKLRESLDAADRLVAAQQLKIADLELPESPVESAVEDEENDHSPDKRQGVARAQMAIVADMMYGAYYDENGLSPDVRSKVRKLTADSLSEIQRLEMEAFKDGDKTAAEVKREHDGLENQMIADLRNILDEEQMEAWEIYHEESAQFLYENLIDGHLRMLAPGLSDANHDAATVVFAEKIGAALKDFESSSEIYSLSNYNRAQSRGLNEALIELSELFQEDQYTHAERFVVQSEELFKAMEGSGAE